MAGAVGARRGGGRRAEVRSPRKRRRQRPPFVSSVEVEIGRSVVRVKLPPASGFAVGERTTVEADYKGHKMRVALVRVEGGWDIEG